MFYDPAMEKIKAIDFVNQSMGLEIQYNKQEKVQRAITIALEELQEFEQKCNRFIESVEHLCAFDDLIRPMFMNHVTQILQQAKHMMEKTYSQEELAALPEHVYNEIVTVQKKRVEVLKKVAARYLS